MSCSLHGQTTQLVKKEHISFSLLLYLASITFTLGSEKELIENEEGNQEKKRSLCSRIVAGKLNLMPGFCVLKFLSIILHKSAIVTCKLTQK